MHRKWSDLIVLTTATRDGESSTGVTICVNLGTMPLAKFDLVQPFLASHR
jgi:hypothetical protein